MPTPLDNLAQDIDQCMAMFFDTIASRLEAWLGARTPVAFVDMEHEIHGVCRQLADEITACILITILADVEFQARTQGALHANESTRYRHGGCRTVTVMLLGGKKVAVKVAYFKPDRRGQPGPRRSRRGAGGAGVYPALAALGIARGMTLAVAAEVCRQVAESDSLRSARAALARRGLQLGHKKTLATVRRFGDRVVKQRDEWIANINDGEDSGSGSVSEWRPLAGKRVVISMDGGRLRLRQPHRRGRRRANGHRGFQVPWKEPKLLVIYVIDDDGRIDHEFRSIYDATMGDCDAIVAMLTGYLTALGAADAEQLIVVADGAKWIWDRIEAIRTTLGLEAKRVIQVADWYHVVEKLGDIANACRGFSAAERTRWLRIAKKLLRAGDIEALVEHIESLAVGRRAKSIRAHLPYFSGAARERMRYRRFRALKVPIGSGAVESAVRRVINLRIKGNAKFWLEASAEVMLLLRSYAKSGRFDDLVRWSGCQAAAWWMQAPTASSQLDFPTNVIGMTPPHQSSWTIDAMNGPLKAAS